MKKNIKSKIVVPALGLILLSTAASISGSVAWFTANRTGKVTTGQFAVVKGDGNLMATVAAGVGTEAALDNKSVYSIINPKSETTPSAWTAGSTDVSFNPATKQLWNDNDGGTGASFVEIGTTSSYSNLTENGHPYVLSATEHVYYAFTWKTTLTYTWGADHTALNVFFDYSQSVMTGADQTNPGSGAKNTKEGFRIAVIADGGAHGIIWAGLQSDETKMKSVISSSATARLGDTGLQNTNYGYFSADSFAVGNTTTLNANPYAVATDRSANQTSRADYLGQITYSGATDHIDLYCIAWYEGTDAAVVDDSKLQQVSSTLAFYSCISA